MATNLCTAKASSPVAAAFVLLPSAFVFLSAAPASAATPAPVDWSFYEYGSSWTSMYTLGCNQVRYDEEAQHSTFVILDFGALYDNSGGQMNFSKKLLTPAQIKTLATAFAYGYTVCGSHSSFWLDLAVGTSNYDAMDYTKGVAFAHTVNQVAAWENAYGWHVATWGANDIESWGNPGIGVSTTYNWYNGYKAAGGPSYVDYGSANGCPTTGFGSICSDGWTQGDYYNLSWREPLAWPAPEVYYTVNAEQWAFIGRYGAPFDGMIQPKGPLDDNFLTSSTLDVTTAWDATEFIFCPYTGCGSLHYSLQMHNVT